jgi:predicted CopG family antitoxin
MGRPRIGHTRKITIPDDVYADLRLMASIEAVPVSNVMRDAMAKYTREFLDEHGEPRSSKKGKKAGAA